MHVTVWLHGFMAAFFTVMGAWFVAKRSCFGSFEPFCVPDADPDDDLTEQRVAAVFRRRARRERDLGPAPGLALAGLAFVLGALAATTAVSVAALYAGFVVGLAILRAAAAELVRRSQRRVASLVVRDRNDAMPLRIVALDCVAALSPLVWAPDVPGPSVAVALGGVVILALAFRVASRPAELQGDDVAAEAFVDRRVRVARVAGLLAIAPAPAFVFASFSGWTETSARVVALALAVTACAVAGWRMRVALRVPSASEFATWLHAAS